MCCSIMERDLMALDGTMANEISIDKISLLTLDEYGAIQGVFRISKKQIIN